MQPFLDFMGRWGLTAHGLVTLTGLMVYAVASHTRRQRRHPSAAIAWVVSLALMPYLALPLYLLFGSRKVIRAPALCTFPAMHVEGETLHAPVPRFEQLASAMGLLPAAAYEELVIHQDGHEALQALHRIAQGATRTLDICTFLLGRDVVGQDITALLMRKAREGVRVRLMIDGIGLYMGGHPRLKPLSEAGVQVALFVSPFRSPLPGRTNLRNHRKIGIADGQRMWSGGRNLAAEYFTGDATSRPPKKPWTDLSFDFCGDLVGQAQQRFDQDWAFATQGRQSMPQRLRPAVPRPGACRAQLIPSGPDQAEDTLYSMLIASFFTAQTRILIVTPYFVPDATLLMALTLAARRGVAVDLVLPRRSNHRLADMARPAALREMSAAGARIWLADGMVHAKAIVIDSDLALSGSANLDERSLFLNYELVVAFFEPADVHRFAQWIDHQRAAASPYRAHTPSAMREFSEGLIRWLAFQL